jgi:hypothetical protein
VRDAITARLDMGTFAANLAQEKDERERIRRAMSKLSFRESLP